MIFGRKIELKVYVNKYDSVSDKQTPSRSLALLCFLHELLMSFRMQIMAKRYKYINIFRGFILKDLRCMWMWFGST
jgi:hypothetical protein